MRRSFLNALAVHKISVRLKRCLSRAESVPGWGPSLQVLLRSARALQANFLRWLPLGVAGANTAAHALLDRIRSQRQMVCFAAAPAAATPSAQWSKPAREFAKR